MGTVFFPVLGNGHALRLLKQPVEGVGGGKAHQGCDLFHQMCIRDRLSDERFMKLSQRYDEEQQSLKKEIAELESVCDKEDSRVYSKNQFLKAVRKFMQMKTLTPTMLHELVERIDVYHIQGTGKNRTQRLVIHYKFVGVLDFPRSPALPENVVLNSRQGVEIEYLVGKAG